MAFPIGFFYFLISFSSCSSFSLAMVTNIPVMRLTCSRGRINSLVCISKHHLQYQICCVCNLRNTFLRCGLLSQRQGRNSWSSLWCRMQLFSGAGHIFRYYCFYKKGNRYEILHDSTTSLLSWGCSGGLHKEVISLEILIAILQLYRCAKQPVWARRSFDLQ